MEKYPKIQTAWERDPTTKYRTLLEGKWATPEFAALADLDWEWTEKIDGTNIRVGWNGETVEFGGRTERAQIPAPLVKSLTETFTPDSLANTPPCTIYGEGYGSGIQKAGKDYLPDVGFIAFDVKIGDVWLRRDDVYDISRSLGVPSVPAIGAGPLRAAIRAARDGIVSAIAYTPGTLAEGLVMRPPYGLLDRQGNRIITKIKHKDFVGG